MSPRAQNMKTGPDVLGTAENESGSAKLKNGTRRPRYRGRRVTLISLWDKWNCFRVQQRPLLAGGASLLHFLPLSYDLSLIIDIYP
jgi:hypothetical protein